MLVSEINYDIHFAFHFLSIDKDIVTSVRNLKKRRKRKKLMSVFTNYKVHYMLSK